MAYERLIRWAFDRFYREFAWTYDGVAAAVSRGHWAMWRRAALPYLRGSVLELGCGTGGLHQTLAAGSLPLVGLDSSAQMLALTRRRLRRAALPFRLVRATAQALPFPSASFDTIIATFPSEYIVDPATIADMWRVLRPDGRVVIVLAAVFERLGLYERAVALAYWLAGLSTPVAAADDPPRSVVGERLAQVGFAIEERWESAPESRVHLILAHKPA